MVFGRKKKEKKEVERIDYDTEPEESDEEGSEEEQDTEDFEEVREKAREYDRLKNELKPASKIPALPETWVVKDIPIQSEKVLFNQKTNKAIDLHSAIAKILNFLEA
jgi:hypothetical protein